MKLLTIVFAFLVSWQVSQEVSMPCPDTAKIDPYTGRTASFAMVCAVNHYRIERYPMTKVFNTREAVNEFIENAPGSVSGFTVEEIE